MKIAIDVSPLHSGHFLQHRVRGTGFYLRNLLESLQKYYPQNQYVEYKRGDSLSGKIDLIHYPYFEPFFLTLPLRKKRKTVVTVHDLTPLVFADKFPAGVKGNLRWAVQKKSLEKSDAIITDSQSSKKDIVKFVDVPEDKVHVVYLAAGEWFKQLNDKAAEKSVKKKFGLPNEFVLYVGDATWNKNLPGLIKAIEKTNLYLVIAGAAFVNKSFDRNNPWNKDLDEAQKLVSQNKKIISTGFVEDSDLVALYNAAKVFVMPSFYEGFGLPVLEAMQSGCPVVTAKMGSLPEIAGEAAYFVDPYDTEEIASGIKNVMENADLRKELSEKGLSQAKKFSWKKTAVDTIKVYGKIKELSN